MLHFHDFKTAEGIALGMVHLTGHSQQTGLCWASVPRDFIFLSFLHLVASSRTQRDAAGSRSHISPRGALPAQSIARHWVWLLSHQTSPFLLGQAGLCVPSYWTLLPVAAPKKQLQAPSDWRMLSGLTKVLLMS